MSRLVQTFWIKRDFFIDADKNGAKNPRSKTQKLVKWLIG
jgi:hypothetical protein